MAETMKVTNRAMSVVRGVGNCLMYSAASLWLAAILAYRMGPEQAPLNRTEP